MRMDCMNDTVGEDCNMMEYTNRILIADSNEEFAKLLQDIIERDPNRKVVGIAADGAKAVELVETLKPDVLLLEPCISHSHLCPEFLSPVSGYDAYRH